MSQEVLSLLGLALLGSVAGLVGGVIFLVKKSLAEKLSVVAVPFAAGVLVSVAMLDLLPESIEIYENAFLVALLSFLGAFIFENLVIQLHHHDGHKHEVTSVPLIILGDTIHNFIDGVAIAAAFLADPLFGLFVAIATFLHETPHEIADFGVLLSAGWSRTKTFITNLLSASATVPGALLVYFYAGGEAGFVGPLLAVSAGIFLYLGATDFLPEVLHDKKGRAASLIPVLLGVLLVFLATTFFHFG